MITQTVTTTMHQLGMVSNVLIVDLRSMPTPGRFFFQKIDFFHFLIFCSTSYNKENNAK